MEYVALVLWLSIAAMALPLGAAAIAHLAFGVQAPAVLGALALCVVFIATSGSDWAAWGALACGIVALIAVAIGAAWVIRSDRAVSVLGQTHEESIAAVAGIELPLLAAATLINVAVVGGMTVA